MNENDYTELSTDELIAETERIRKALFKAASLDAIIDESVYLGDALESAAGAEGIEELKTQAESVIRELDRRYDEGSRPLDDITRAVRRIPEARNRERHYFMELEVTPSGDFSYKWNVWNGKVRAHLYWKKDDENTTIPDEEMLAAKPWAWLTKQLESGEYIEFEPVYDDPDYE